MGRVRTANVKKVGVRSPKTYGFETTVSHWAIAKKKSALLETKQGIGDLDKPPSDKNETEALFGRRGRLNNETKELGFFVNKSSGNLKKGMIRSLSSSFVRLSTCWPAGADPISILSEARIVTVSIGRKLHPPLYRSKCWLIFGLEPGIIYRSKRFVRWNLNLRSQVRGCWDKKWNLLKKSSHC